LSQDTTFSGSPQSVLKLHGRVRSFHSHGGWHYIEVPEAVVDQLRTQAIGRREFWGSIPIHVTLGATTWPTSVMCSRNPEFHFVPINKSVRLDEHVTEGVVVSVSLTAR